jgi:hypothetical protein
MDHDSFFIFLVVFYLTHFFVWGVPVRPARAPSPPRPPRAPRMSRQVREWLRAAQWQAEKAKRRALPAPGLLMRLTNLAVVSIPLIFVLGGIVRIWSGTR